MRKRPVSSQDSQVPMRAIAWKLSDIKGVSPDFVLTKFYEEDFEHLWPKVREGGPTGDNYGANYTAKKGLDSDSIGPPSTRLPMTLSTCSCICQRQGKKLRKRDEMTQISIQVCESLTSGAFDFMGPFPFQEEQVHTRGC
ncbi:hypothetical protein Tco_0863181 [Tanacetum coccineum]